MRTIFLGTPAIAVPFLNLTAQNSQLQLVVTNPDQPAGRGYEIKASPVKQAALEHKMEVCQPETLRDPVFKGKLAPLDLDLGVVVAYGKLIPPNLLSIPKLGFLNVHFSLLPAYRGAAPIQWALINGETQTGVSLFWLDEGMDTGPLFLQRWIPIEQSDDAESLRTKLVALGLEILKEGLELLKKGERIAVAQPVGGSLAPQLKREDGHMIWSQTASQCLNRLRGTTPWPGAFALLRANGKEQRLKILQGEKLEGFVPGGPGTVIRLEGGKGPVIKCGTDLFVLANVQPEGKSRMSGWEFWQGARMKLGDQLY